MGGDDGEVKRSRVFKSGLFIPTILLLLCLTTKAYFKVEDEAVCAGVDLCLKRFKCQSFVWI